MSTHAGAYVITQCKNEIEHACTHTHCTEFKGPNKTKTVQVRMWERPPGQEAEVGARNTVQVVCQEVKWPYRGRP